MDAVDELHDSCSSNRSPCGRNGGNAAPVEKDQRPHRSSSASKAAPRRVMGTACPGNRDEVGVAGAGGGWGFRFAAGVCPRTAVFGGKLPVIARNRRAP